MEEQLWSACKNGKVEEVRRLIQNSEINTDWQNDKDYLHGTPFYIACSRGHTEIVKLLLNDKRVDINKTNVQGWTPFFIAYNKGYLEIMEYILASRNDVDLTIEWLGRKRELVIDFARKKGDTEKASWESEEGCQKRKRDCLKIVELLESFERNPIETRFKLRLKLGLAGKKSII